MSLYLIGALVESMLINQGTSMDTVRALKSVEMHPVAD